MPRTFKRTRSPSSSPTLFKDHDDDADARDDEERAILMSILMSSSSEEEEEEEQPASCCQPSSSSMDCMAVALKLSSECNHDLWQLMARLPKLESASVLWRVHLNLEYFNCSLTLHLRAAKERATLLLCNFVHELIEAIAAIEDSHVMLETLNFADEFDGNRKAGRGLEKRLPSKLVPVAFS